MKRIFEAGEKVVIKDLSELKALGCYIDDCGDLCYPNTLTEAVCLWGREFRYIGQELTVAYSDVMVGRGDGLMYTLTSADGVRIVNIHESAIVSVEDMFKKVCFGEALEALANGECSMIMPESNLVVGAYFTSGGAMKVARLHGNNTISYSEETTFVVYNDDIKGKWKLIIDQDRLEYNKQVQAIIDTVSELTSDNEEAHKAVIENLHKMLK